MVRRDALCARGRHHPGAAGRNARSPARRIEDLSHRRELSGRAMRCDRVAGSARSWRRKTTSDGAPFGRYGGGRQAIRQTPPTPVVPPPRVARGAMELRASDRNPTCTAFDRHAFRASILYRTTTDAANTDSDYNVVGWVSTDSGNTRIALAFWQAAGHGPHSFSAALSSLFLNPATPDYHLLNSSPAIDRGLTLAGVPTDLDGNMRPHGLASDIGC